MKLLNLFTVIIITTTIMSNLKGAMVGRFARCVRPLATAASWQAANRATLISTQIATPTRSIVTSSSSPYILSSMHTPPVMPMSLFQAGEIKTPAPTHVHLLSRPEKNSLEIHNEWLYASDDPKVIQKIIEKVDALLITTDAHDEIHKSPTCFFAAHVKKPLHP